VCNIERGKGEGTAVKRIEHGEEGEAFREAVAVFRRAPRAGALTGAGISVESGIPDFRSPGGLWSIFAPEEFATIDTFLESPEKAWRLYRALGRSIEGKAPNAAHLALARLEDAGRLHGIVTQNVDGLHAAAGSRRIFEVHGDHRRLQCLACGRLEPFHPDHLDEGPPPVCPACTRPLKPNVVLFGEAVRDLDAIHAFLDGCDALLVVGTSAQVYPVADLPLRVARRGGTIFEFNLEETPLSRGEVFGVWGLGGGAGAGTDFFFPGPAGGTLRRFADAVLTEGGHSS